MGEHDGELLGKGYAGADRRGGKDAAVEFISKTRIPQGTIRVGMRFEYQISVNEYVAGSTLYYKLISKGRRFSQGLFWIFAGLFLILIGYRQRVIDWPLVILICIGGWWLYCGITRIFPSLWYRHEYRSTSFAGKSYIATLDASGFEVEAEDCKWVVKWPAVEIKGENKNVFVICAANTIFMFGKKYLTTEQQQELRTMAQLS